MAKSARAVRSRAEAASGDGVRRDTPAEMAAERARVETAWQAHNARAARLPPIFPAYADTPAEGAMCGCCLGSRYELIGAAWCCVTCKPGPDCTRPLGTGWSA